MAPTCLDRSTIRVDTPKAFNRAPRESPLVVSVAPRWHKGQDSLLTSADDNNIGLDGINILGSLFLPANGSRHMTVQRVDFGELVKSLDRSVHSPQLPSFDRVYCIDDSRCVDERGIEGKSELQVREVWVWSLYSRSGGQKAKVATLGRGQEVLSSTKDVFFKVEGPIVPGEGKLVPPNTYPSASRQPRRHSTYRSPGRDR
jgi:hypothetical protein